MRRRMVYVNRLWVERELGRPKAKMFARIGGVHEDEDENQAWSHLPRRYHSETR
jgi:hypothetical protein